MGFQSFLTSLFPKPPDACSAVAWKPWQQSRLAEVSAYLSTKTAPLSEADAVLAMELLINGLPPTEVIKTLADYDLAVAKMREKIRYNIAHPMAWKPPITREDVQLPGKLRHRIFSLYDEREAVVRTPRPLRTSGSRKKSRGRVEHRHKT